MSNRFSSVVREESGKSPGELFGEALLSALVTFFLGGVILMVFTDLLLSIWDKPGLGYWVSAGLALTGRLVIRSLFTSDRKNLA